jgi:WD40 repeat protein
VFSRLPSPVWRLWFTPDGRKLLSGSSDGRIERWPVEARPPEAEAGFSRLPPGRDFVTVAPDGKQFGGLRQGKIYLENTEAPGRVSELPNLGTNNTCLLFSPDGQALFAGTETGVVQVWSVAGRALLRRVRCRPEPVLELLQDRAGRTLVVRQAKRAFVRPPYHVGVWGTHDWQPQATSLELSASEYLCALSPDGGWFATGQNGGPVRLRSLSGPCRTNELALTGRINGLAFSPDGRLLAAATEEGVVKVWELPTCREVKELRARSQALFAITFSPDSRRLATAGHADEAIKLWDVATWQELITLERPGENLRQLAFSADGNRLIARKMQCDVLIWRVPSLVEIEAAENKSNVH